ncbi:alpha-amylase family glycosyl hydrolase [Aquimarina litoralis]|uniref:alpha-amylase family glycosyl hydrolase n=1 Tax=Aquimarina litoralis TaxID=584605 RepID=UPI001C5609D0|nr:alpha-amylase family glycosyl hydrolase [Aquimarina litoralis]MBW1294474.1 T9SS type A sorting domain-containing protein [Aquimarina litoralis]
MKKFTLLLIFFLGLTLSHAQQQNATFTIDPAAFNEDDEITITVSGIDLSLWGNTDLYLWAWYFDSPTATAAINSPNNGDWTDSSNATTPQVFTDNGDGTYSITLTPTTFYGATGIDRIGMLAKAQDGTGDNKTQDNVVNVGIFQLTLNTPTDAVSIIDNGSDLAISATSTVSADFELFANGASVDTQAGITNYTTNYTITEGVDFELVATETGTTNSLSETFSAITTPVVTEAPVPAGMQDGLNLDGTSATFVLFAPGKDYVHLKGNFNGNDWSLDNTYLLNKDSAQDKFWITIDNLPNNADILYQYVVDASISVADPYSTLILSEFNDGFIDDTTFPNLPDYPTGKTNDAVSWFKTGEADYVWQTTNFQRPAVTDLVIYELLIRDFDNLHSFDAVKARLDYLEDLGVNAIELLPVSEFDGNISWGYNPSFHMALDKYYGTPTAFKQFVDECHARGIAVILDVVYNHATGQNPYYRMWNTSGGGYGGQASADSPFFNQTATHSFSVFNDFDHSKQATQDYVKRTVEYWIEEYNVDGFRWDLTKGFTQNCTASNDACTNSFQQDRVDILKEYADYQWDVDPNFYVIFEHLGGIAEEKEWADYRANEGKGILLWNKQTDPYNESTMGYHDNGKSNFSGVSYAVKGFDGPSAISYMESHDEERLMYKNVQFGNATNAPTYDVTELSTALDRVELAGAFYFTVPGPKMIWQFGELGYGFSINRCEDGSIDNGCRTNPKPIRWDYLNVSDRTDVYDIYAKLIKLKLNEKIFKTDNFTLSVSTSNKKIQLTDDAATGDEIRYVTIIGNFGVNTISMNPTFQETGTWYDLLDDTGASIEVTDVNATISLEPGEFKVYANEQRSLSTPDITNNLTSFNAYPNPAKTAFSIDESVQKVFVYNITGALAKKFEGNFEAGSSFEIGDLARGLYLVQIQNEKGIATTKLSLR